MWNLFRSEKGKIKTAHEPNGAKTSVLHLSPLKSPAISGKNLSFIGANYSADMYWGTHECILTGKMCGTLPLSLLFN